METNVFTFSHYIDFIHHWTQTHGHGSKSQISKVAEIQTTYLSLILKKEAHLSLEQAVKLKDLFEFNQEELAFFILLIQKNRAGALELEHFFESQIQFTLSKRNLIKERIKNSVTLNVEQETKYFSSWHYAAIHTLLLIPEYRTQKTIEDFFHLPPSSVREALDFLESLNLIKKENGLYLLAPFRMHLPLDSTILTLHHNNWRIQALKNLQKKQETDFHYSAVLSLSKKDSEEFKQKLLNLIEEFERNLKNSKDEVLYSLGMDWFNLKEQNFR